MGRTCGEPDEIELTAMGVTLNGSRCRHGECSKAGAVWADVAATDMNATARYAAALANCTLRRNDTAAPALDCSGGRIGGPGPGGAFPHVSTAGMVLRRSSPKALDLSHNALTTLDGAPAAPGSEGRAVFASLPHLTDLDLSHNRLPSLPGGVFGGLAFLVNLDLSHNLLSILPGGVLGGLAHLAGLDLSHNLLVGIPDGVLGAGIMVGLLHLDLSHNKITSLAPDTTHVAALPGRPPGPMPGARGLSRLETLDLSFNPLDQGAGGTGQMCVTLRSAVLNNKGSKVPYQPGPNFRVYVDSGSGFVDETHLISPAHRGGPGGPDDVFMARGCDGYEAPKTTDAGGIDFLKGNRSDMKKKLAERLRASNASKSGEVGVVGLSILPWLGVKSISPAHLHVRPMGRTCRRENYAPEKITALLPDCR